MEEKAADQRALRVVAELKALAKDIQKLDAKTLRELLRVCMKLAADCIYYIPVRLEQGGGKSQHRRR